ncbi:MAG: hypothetical protein JNK60_13645 [Acidobacteria bacterium]|nr:hypothetical protein [Acidobacteriota bacterium]
MTRTSLLYALLRGFVASARTWKALLVALFVNGLIATVAVAPLAASLHESLDRLPGAGSESPVLLFLAFQRHDPGVFGPWDRWQDLLTGGEVDGSFFSMPGAAGSLLWVGLLSVLVNGLLAGGFAGRVSGTRDRSSLAAFGADCGKFAATSLVFTCVSLAGLLGAYVIAFQLPGRLYDPAARQYEWEHVLLLLARLAAFLVVAGIVRLVVLYARATTGLSRKGNPFVSLYSAATFVLSRPLATLTLDVLIGLLGLVPLGAWLLFAPEWDGRSPAGFALSFAVLQASVLLRIFVRVAHLGAAATYLRGATEKARPAPDLIEPPGP